MAAHDQLRRRQGPGRAAHRRLAHLPGRRHRLPAGQARARVRPPAAARRLRPPRLCAGAARRRWPRWAPIPTTLEVPILQFVHLVEGSERAAFSKRRGAFVTLDELLDEIGVDATRFFMLQRSHDRTLDLDLDLARSQSAENPVYYVQYAHARIASMLARVGEDRVAEAVAAGRRRRAGDRRGLHPSERALILKLLAFPDEVAEAADTAGAPPDRRLRARAGPGVHRLLPGLPGGRGRRPSRSRASASRCRWRRSARSRSRSGCSGSRRRSRCSPPARGALRPNARRRSWSRPLGVSGSPSPGRRRRPCGRRRRRAVGPAPASAGAASARPASAGDQQRGGRM